MKLQQQALQNATSSTSVYNYQTILNGFVEKGIPESQITPRVNVFTYQAWKAKSRQVRKGESGVKILVWIPISKLNKKTGQTEQFKKKKVTTVFHISQTDPK